MLQCHPECFTINLKLSIDSELQTKDGTALWLWQHIQQVPQNTRKS